MDEEFKSLYQDMRETLDESVDEVVIEAARSRGYYVSRKNHVELIQSWLDAYSVKHPEHIDEEDVLAIVYWIRNQPEGEYDDKE